ncbi:unnamed protein product [Miscanthus lutarioriparius]|uniref:FBD domain-containing protein n=1 Tax=Miscanthus lutarioriparius TaxID=422564 RepID=A0A811NTW4_9POAL|nr:unnamed protein product [Miscanthus lutarioriparius]
MAEAVIRDAIELPCFDRAQRLLLNLGYLCLALPPSGVFTKLTVMVLSHVRFQGASDIGDTFSSSRCPSLRLLSLEYAQGVSHLSICSESLLGIYLHILYGLQQLTVVSPMLRELRIWCFKSQPVADITAPVLEKLWWVAAYDPRSVQLGKLAQLRELATSFFAYTSYGLPEHQYNLGNAMLLQRYRKIADLRITIDYPTSMVHIEYLMEALTLPPVKNLHLFLVTYGHHIGSCVFYFLKISTSIRRLFLNIQEVIKEKTSCLPGCFCHGEKVWETEELFLNSLQELYICGFNGSDYDFAFVKRLLGWARMLKSVHIKFDPQETSRNCR